MKLVHWSILLKKEKGTLIWFAVALNYCSKIQLNKQVPPISVFNWFRSKFMILTLFVQEKVQSLGILRLSDTRINGGSGGGGSLWESVTAQHLSGTTGSGCKSLVLGWPPTPVWVECLKKLKHICRGIHSASNMPLQLVASVFVWV